MMNEWDKIAYIVQLAASCFLFMLPARKRGHFYARVLAGFFLLLLISFGTNSVLESRIMGPWTIVYWSGYVLLCIPYIWACLDISFLKAVYCAVCACAMQHVAYDMVLIYQILGGLGSVVPVLLYVGIYGAFYRLFAGRLSESGDFAVSRRALFPMVTIILLVWILSVLEVSGRPGFEAGIWNRVIYRVIDALCCFYVLWMQVYEKERMSLERELDGINNAWRQQKKQYEVTRETIDSINRKCHDLKHQIRALRKMADEQERKEFIDSIEQDIMIYDTAVKTGNQALDTVLMDKGLFCKDHGIAWSCMADGSMLDFMRVEDIYAIFGNALDNAVSAVLKLSDPDKRIISVKIITQNNLVVIQIQNYYDADLQFNQGLPLTTKHNKQDHGYGMKSIRYTAEKYNGTITVNAEHQIFKLQILIPVPLKHGAINN